MVLLLDAGADPLAPTDFDDDTQPPLTLAAQKGHGKIARLLWYHAAAQQPEELHRANDGWRPFLSCLVRAATYGRVTLVADFLDWWDGWSAAEQTGVLLAIAGRWQLYIVEPLLEPFMYPLEIILQALHRAADSRFMLLEEERSGVRYGGTDYVDEELPVARLIDAAADPNGSFQNQRPLDRASASIDLVDAMTVLLEKGADPSATNKRGQPVLHHLDDLTTSCLQRPRVHI